MTLILYERERRELGSFYRQPRGASSSLLSHRQPRPAQVPGGARAAGPGGCGGGGRDGGWGSQRGALGPRSRAGRPRVPAWPSGAPRPPGVGGGGGRRRPEPLRGVAAPVAPLRVRSRGGESCPPPGSPSPPPGRARPGAEGRRVGPATRGDGAGPAGRARRWRGEGGEGGEAGKPLGEERVRVCVSVRPR